MKTLELLGGDDIYDVLQKACMQNQANDVAFEFNQVKFIVQKGEAFDSAKPRWTNQTGIEPLSAEESSKRAKARLDEMEARSAKEIAETGAMTEAQLRDSKPPSCKDIQDLVAYIESLVNRPHDYGTCVYAMSLSAVATLNYVAHKLGVTGFQASCADMDILRHTRDFKWGRIVNYDNLLFPQYCNEKYFPGHEALLVEHKDELAKRAKAKLEDNPEHCHPHIIEHWKRLVAATTKPD